MSEADVIKVPTRHSEAHRDTAHSDTNSTNMAASPDGAAAVDGDGALPPNVEWKPSRPFLLAMGALCALALGVAIDATSLSVALPQLSNELGGTALEAFWAGTSFLLSSTVLQPPTASLSNILGRKNVLYGAIALFFAGSLIGALAGNFTVLLAGRTIQGLGGGGLTALMEVIVTDLVPLKHRGTWFSMLSAMWSIGTVTGPLIGASFAQNVTWRWIFYLNLPIIGLGLGLVIIFLNQKRIPGGIAAKLQRFDWIGSFLFTAGSTVFLFGISVGGVMYPWNSAATIVPIILGPLVLVAFAIWEGRYAEVPIINYELFNKWTMISAYVQTVLHGMILWSLLYFLVLYYQGVKSLTPIVSAVAVLPETLTVAPAGMGVGILVGITLKYRWAVWSGWAITTLGAGLLYLLEPDSTTAQWVFLNLPIGLGTGMLFPAMALTIQASSEPRLNGQAQAFFSFLRSFGQSLGVAVSGVIFQNALRTQLNNYPAFADMADDYSRDATIVVSVIKSMPDGQARTDLVQAYNDGLKVVWLSLLAFSAVGLIASLAVKSYSLDQEHVTDQGLRDDGPEVRNSKDEESGNTTEK